MGVGWLVYCGVFCAGLGVGERRKGGAIVGCGDRSGGYGHGWLGERMVIVGLGVADRGRGAAAGGGR